MITKKIRGQGKVIIFGATWVVKVYPFANDDFGETFMDKHEIHINSNKSPASFYDTLLHESLHAIEMSTKLALTEDQVHRLSTYLRDFFKSNPKVGKWLMK